MAAYYEFDCILLSIQSFTRSSTRWIADFSYTSAENKMDEMIKHYEALSVTTPAAKRDMLLASKNIYYFDERKAVGGLAFDKRSPEGREFIEAKLVVKRERLLARRARSANDRRRDHHIDVRRQAVLEN
ncbi:hypothetical protein GGH91_000563 [Coemansia sp. RSA 2671]|nr:hypothetical protein LPJ60_001182 [Coemansia sp. RSA 2675]KAJ2349863.1 hypothetical protein GGH91_000563 [Coemansia sp. RSA 2671]